MTRINFIPVAELHSKHLVAEYRELPRIFGLVAKAHIDRRLHRINIPSHYLLGSGHCYFFYNKLKYLSDKHIELVNEMKARGYKPSHEEILEKTFDFLPKELYNSWCPDGKAKKINRERIRARLPKAN